MLLTALFYTLFMEAKCSKAVSSGFKMAATLCASLPALTGALQSGALGIYMIYAGLFIGAAADYLLCYDVLSGGILFGIGHIVYCVSFCLLHTPGPVNLVVTAALFCLCIGLYLTGRHRIKENPGGIDLRLLLIYALLEAMLIGLSLGINPILTAGTMLFTVSDALLAWRSTAKAESKAWRRVCLGTYYLAQLLISVSVFFS